MGFAEGFDVFFRILVTAMISFATAYRVITALFDREIGEFGGILLLGGLLGLAATAITNIHSYLFFLFLLGMFVWLGLAFVLPAAFMERERQRMLEDDLQRSLQGVAFDPSNVAAYCMLADTYRKMGELDLAIENYRKALELQPTLKRERQRLETALRDKAEMTGCKRPLQGDGNLSAFRRCAAVSQKGLARLRELPRIVQFSSLVVLAVAFLGMLFLLPSHPWLGMFIFLGVVIALFRTLSKIPEPTQKS